MTVTVKRKSGPKDKSLEQLAREQKRGASGKPAAVVSGQATKSEDQRLQEQMREFLLKRAGELDEEDLAFARTMASEPFGLLQSQRTRAVLILARQPMTKSKVNGHAQPAIAGPNLTPAETATTTPAGIAANDRRAISGETFDAGQVVKVGLDLIHVHPKNRRPDAAKVKELAESFREKKQQQPILLRVPPAGSAYKLPAGEFQIVFGERRYRAAKLAGWESIEARIRTDLDDAETLDLMAEENAKRQDLNPIDKARMIEALCESGRTREQAALRVGLQSGSAASNLVRLLDLPKVWQDRVAGGELPESFARLLLPYVPAPKLMDAINADYLASKKSKREWDRECWERRDRLERTLEGLVDKHTRPIDPKHEVAYSYSQIGTYASHGRLFELTDKVKGTLDVVTLAVDGEPREVATNVKAFDKLQLPLVKAKHKGTIERNRRVYGSPAKAKEKKPAKLTPAQLAKKREDEDKQLAATIELWRHNWLMELVYRDLAAAEPTNVNQATQFSARMLLLAFLAADGTQDWYGEGADAAIAEVLGKKAPKRDWKNNCRRDLWELLLQAGGKIDKANDCGLAVCRALLLSPEPLSRASVKYPCEPDIATAIVEDLARLLKIDVGDEWERLQDRTKKSTEKITSFYDLHTPEQLDALGREFGLFVDFAKGKGDKIKALVASVSPGGTKRLPLPKLLKPIPATGEAAKRKGKGRK